jgi:hypothetical protein
VPHRRPAASIQSEHRCAAALPEACAFRHAVAHISGYPPHPRAWPLFRSPSLSVQTRVPPWFIPNSARLAFVPDQSRRARVQP